MSITQRLAGTLLAAILVAQPLLAAPPPTPNVGPTEAEFETPVAIQGPTTLRVTCRGQNFSFKAKLTTLSDEFMVVADAPELQKIARAFGASFEWDSETLTLTCRRDKDTRTMKIGQDRVSRSGQADGSQEAELPLSAQLVDGAVHIPLSAVEAFLDVRVTTRPNNRIFIEPLIRSVRFEGTGAKTRLVIDSTGPVSYRTFFLKGPNRFVIDVAGAVLDTSGLTVAHPDLGNVRLGQFELGPAISRIVVPTQGNVEIRSPRSGNGQTLAFNVCLPNQTPATADESQFTKISSVQWDKTAQGAKLVLNATGPLRYDWQRLPDNRVVVDIPNAILSDPKQEFPGNDETVSAVRLSQNQPLPHPSVRVVLDLLKPVDVAMSKGDSEDQLVFEVANKEPDTTAGNRGVGSTRTTAQSGSGLIVIDPGHGGSDVGAQNKSLGINEATVTLDICKRLATLLQQQGWTVIMTRTADVDVSYWGSSATEELGARVKVANEKKADLFVSVHCNASVSPNSNGTSIHYYKQGDYVFASELKSNVMAATGRANRGLQANRFYVLTHAQMPSVLVETAFISNPQEGALLADANYRQRIAEGLAQGVRQYASRNLNWTASKP